MRTTILGFHIMMRLRDSRVIAPSTGARRLLARSFLERGEAFGLLAFRAADTHIHALVLAERAAAGEFARRVELSIQARLAPGVAFAPAHLVPVLDQRHLRNTFLYILRQEQHHRIARDPYHDASSLPDLLGLRAIAPWLPARVAERLPRCVADLPALDALLPDLPDLVGPDSAPTIGQPDVTPASPATPAVLTALADAAAAAVALPRLTGSTTRALAARRAAVALGLELARPAEVARALEIPPRTVSRLARHPARGPLVRAVRAQISLRSGPAALSVSPIPPTGVGTGESTTTPAPRLEPT